MTTQKTPPSLPDRRPTTPMEFQELWDIDQVSNYLGVPKQTIYGGRTEGKGPKGFRVGKYLRWHARTVIAVRGGTRPDFGGTLPPGAPRNDPWRHRRR